MSSQFLPVADTQFRLRGTDALSRWFQHVAEQGHYAGHRFPTRQGIYVCTPGGELLASTAPTVVDSVLVMLRRAIEAWNARPPMRGHSPPEIGRVAIGEDRVPRNGIVLDVTIRELGVDVGESEPPPDESAPFPPRFDLIEGISNFDHAWFSSAEKLEWIPHRLAVGESRRLPDALVARLASLHLLHSAKSPVPARFRTQDVGASWIETTIVAVEGTRVHLRIAGSTSAARSRRVRWNKPCRMETRLLGYATFDSATESFVRFHAVALGRWTELGDREGKASKGAGRGEAPAGKPVGFAFVLAGDEASSRTPPHYLHCYEGEWASSEGEASPAAERR